MIKFDMSATEYRLVAKIAKRAVQMAVELKIPYEYTDCEMDLTACHANGCPLRLEELLGADDGNFGHDVFGIRRFINRSTGKVNQVFCPRYAARQLASV